MSIRTTLELLHNRYLGAVAATPSLPDCLQHVMCFFHWSKLLCWIGNSFYWGYFSAIYIRDFEKGSLSLAAVQECREYNRKTWLNRHVLPFYKTRDVIAYQSLWLVQYLWIIAVFVRSNVLGLYFTLAAITLSAMVAASV